MNPLSLIPALSCAVRAALAALLAVSVTAGAMRLYDRLIDDPFVAREARAGFVALAEKTALEAQLAELRRQAGARQEVLEKFESRRAMADANAAALELRLETEIKAHEDLQKAAGRLCVLDRADIDWLRKP